MEELSLKLKTELVARLRRNKQNIDEPYLVSRDKKYTRGEIATEIELETEIGINMLTNMIMLAIDITSRHEKSTT